MTNENTERLTVAMIAAANVARLIGSEQQRTRILNEATELVGVEMFVSTLSETLVNELQTIGGAWWRDAADRISAGALDPDAQFDDQARRVFGGIGKAFGLVADAFDILDTLEKELTS